MKPVLDRTLWLSAAVRVLEDDFRKQEGAMGDQRGTAAIYDMIRAVRDRRAAAKRAGKPDIRFDDIEESLNEAYDLLAEIEAADAKAAEAEAERDATAADARDAGLPVGEDGSIVEPPYARYP